MTDVPSIRCVLDMASDPPRPGEEVVALVACAVAAEHHDCDCPLGVLVAAEALRAGPSPGGRALRRAAERLLDGTARVLRERALLEAVVACCESRRLGAACPLRTSSR